MKVDWVELTDFRSYRGLHWQPEPGVNLLLGPNGAGKTNLLEAIAYLASLHSFRFATEATLVREGAESAIVRAGVSGQGRERLIEIETPRSGRRHAQVDKSRLQRSSDLLGVLRVIAFLPEDLDLVKRGPAYRREMLDEVAVQLWPAAYLDQAEYERALRQRNALLKAGERDRATLSVWDSRLAQSGGRVMARRSRVIEVIEPLLDASYADIAQKQQRAGIGYLVAGGDDQGIDRSAADFASALLASLEVARQTDYIRKLTTVGPHRDEPVFYLDGLDARGYGSQGEQRTVALAVKLAAHRAVAEMVGEPPVLLLDDVFSELDPERAGALAKALPTDTQTLITSARPEDIPIAGSVWRVGDGVHR
jgi:DNA replication and repair protein RecF